MYFLLRYKILFKSTRCTVLNTLKNNNFKCIQKYSENSVLNILLRILPESGEVYVYIF